MISIVAVLFLHGCSTGADENTATVATQEVKPKIVVSFYSFWSKATLSPSDEPEQNYYLMGMHIENWPDFHSFELLMTFDPNVLERCNPPGTLLVPGITFRDRVIKELSPGVLQIIGKEPLHDDAATTSFQSITFLVIGEGDPNINISFVSAMDLYEQDVDCILEVNDPVEW